MATRKKAKRHSGVKKVASKGNRAVPDNGLRTFTMHSANEESAQMIAKLRDERPLSFAFAAAPVETSKVDPETAATRYLHQALDSKAVPSFTAPKVGDTGSEFKSLGTETIPLTETKTVKFRQTYDKIPVYGSLVTVELDEKNELVSLNSALGQPQGVNPVAKISPAGALASIQKYPGYRKRLDGLVPHPYFYFEKKRSKWHLAFIVEDVPVERTGEKEGRASSPLYMDYVVDAQTGSVIGELPRTPSIAVVDKAVDGKNEKRDIGIESEAGRRLLKDAMWNVQTYDFKFKDPQVQKDKLPGAEIANPPAPWNPAAVSAHANATAVAQFLRDVVKRNSIDNHGGPMNSSINCVVKRESKDGTQWFNAFWNGKQMVYGQRKDGAGLMSLSVDLDVVGHEMFHGVTQFTSRLEYVSQSGSLNESYSDIFGVIIGNWNKPDRNKWNWEIGDGLGPNGKPFRDMSKPSRFRQPENMKQYKNLPENEDGDWGGVHTNSGIHNFAAYKAMTAADGSGLLVLTTEEVAAVFYLALTQHLSRTSQFSDSRRGVLLAAQTLFRSMAAGERQSKLGAITAAFDAVGISD
jgi:Zn-dependent metalloprotease